MRSERSLGPAKQTGQGGGRGAVMRDEADPQLRFKMFAA